MTKYELFDLLGLDPANPQHVQGAVEAALAILRSRHSSGGNLPPIEPDGGNGPLEIKIDPDLIMPSSKNKPTSPQPPIEIEDPDNVLAQIKNTKQSSIDQQTSNGQAEDSDYADESDDSDSSEGSDSSQETSSSKDSTSAAQSEDDKKSGIDGKTETKKSNEIGEDEKIEDEASSGLNDPENTDDDTDHNATDSNNIDYDTEDSDEDSEDVASEDDFEDDENDFEDDEDDFETDEDDFEDDEDDEDDGDNYEKNEIENSDLDDTDETDFPVDSEEAKKLFGDSDNQKASPMARRLKRARVLKAAKEMLEKARISGASTIKIAELEAAIKQLEVLEEALHIDNISEQEFNRRINAVIAAMDSLDATELNKTSDTERKQKVAQIKADLEKPETVDELNAEDEAAIRKERRELRAVEQEKIKNQMAIADRTSGRSASSFQGFEAFVQTLYKAIARQVKTIETTPQTWAALPKRTPGPGVLKKGNQHKQTPDGKIPVLRFYFDCSASWEDSDVQKGLEALKILRDFERQGKLVILERYFSNNVFDNMVDARNQGGTAAWEEIVNEVKTSGTENVVIMTDSDMNYDAQHGPTYVVPGFVWYLWKNGVNSQELPHHLLGRNATYQFSFNTGG